MLHQKGQPVLIGTVSIEKNEELSRLLGKAGVPHEVLNAKNNEKEAAIVARAGQAGSVTLATNIAGRGTDIVLDDDTKKAGGLFVLGSERHESRRIDNQLRGRSGRQGDPGVTQFFVSTEDELMRIFGGERIAAVMDRLKVADDMPIENRIISKSLEGAQKKVEGHNFDTRKNVVQYDDVMNRHRKATYAMRREILHQPDISKRIKLFIADEGKDIAQSPLALSDQYETIVQEVFPFDEATMDKLFDTTAEKFASLLQEAAMALYQERETVFGADDMRKVERDIYLQILDNLWMQHLENMDHLREGIHWVGIGQRDPLVEYRREGQRMFEEMQAALRHDVVRSVLHAEPADMSNQPIETELTLAARQSVDNADKIIEAEEFHEEDFVLAGQSTNKGGSKKVVTTQKRKKARKAERKRRKKGKK